MRVLITGVLGFVGPFLADTVSGQPGVELFGMTLPSGAAADRDLLPPGLKVLTGDVTDDASIQEVLDDTRPDIVFHLAGFSSGAVAWRLPAQCLEVNALGTLRLLEAVRRLELHTTRVVVASSGEVYGGASDERSPLTEGAPLRPLSPYATSKAAQDLVAAQYAVAHSMAVIRLRLFNHTGPGQPPEYVASSFARQIARIERGQQEPVIEVGNLDARRDFVDVRDIVRAYWLAARFGAPGAAYNVCSGRAVSIRDLLDHLLDLSTHPVDVRRDPDRMRPADIPLLIGDPGLLLEETGWKSEIPIEETLRDLLDWWRERV